MDSTPAEPPEPLLDLLEIPLPSDGISGNNPILDNLTLTYLLQALTAVTTSKPSVTVALAHLLDSANPLSLLEWTRRILSQPSYDANSVRQIMTRAYSVLVRATTTQPPQATFKGASSSASPKMEAKDAFLLRFHALSFLVHVPAAADSQANAEELQDKVWDQAVRFSSAFVSVCSKATPDANSTDVKHVMRLVSANFDRLCPAAGGAGKNWDRFLECWADVSRKVQLLYAHKFTRSFGVS